MNDETAENEPGGTSQFGAVEALDTEDGEVHLLVGGALVLVSTPIGNVGDISDRAKESLRRADLVCCEDTRHTGRLLKRLDIHATKLAALHAHNEMQKSTEIAGRIRGGEVVALVCDAGTPIISDPGGRLVAFIIAEGLPVTAVPGPCAVIDALVLSGLPAERFTFEGFLARKGGDRQQQIDRIARSTATSLIYESPLRLLKTLGDLAEACGSDRRVAIARELTKLHEQIWRGTLGQSLSPGELSERGEQVIIVAPAAESQSVEGGELREALERLRTAGLGRRDSVSAIEILLGAPHREVYQMALEMGELKE
jgi:16S rRNA (cytidine1402-2'-O)-methyltransferase